MKKIVELKIEDTKAVVGGLAARRCQARELLVAKRPAAGCGKVATTKSF